jgi:hypothetical protein
MNYTSNKRSYHRILSKLEEKEHGMWNTDHLSSSPKIRCLTSCPLYNQKNTIWVKPSNLEGGFFETL